MSTWHNADGFPTSVRASWPSATDWLAGQRTQVRTHSHEQAQEEPCRSPEMDREALENVEAKDNA